MVALADSAVEVAIVVVVEGEVAEAAGDGGRVEETRMVNPVPGMTRTPRGRPKSRPGSTISSRES